VRNIAILSSVLLVANIGCGDNADTVLTITGSHSVAVGQSIALFATTNANGSSQDSGEYLWQSDNPAIATVSAEGIVTGVAAGDTAITAQDPGEGITASHTIVVAQPRVVVSGTTVVALGKTTAFTATTINAADGSYTWTVGDEGIARVDGGGVVTGVGTGETTLTATGDDTGASGTATVTVTAGVPNIEAWRNSAHADSRAEAFRHWDEEDPAEVPATCARCHSRYGYQDYLGADGSEFGVVDRPAALGSVVDCETCHNTATDALAEVTFPSGVTLGGLGPEARCMTCHQGRSSGDTVVEDIAAAGVGDDEVSADLHFVNIHYYAAGATINAGRVRGGYQ